jgi:ribosomal protein L11 methyltransferase
VGVNSAGSRGGTGLCYDRVREPIGSPRTVSREYWSLTVLLAPEAADAVANHLTESGALGVVEEGESRPVRLRAFFPPGTDPDGTARRVADYLAELRLLAIPIDPGTLGVSAVPEEAWADAWRAHFRPLPIGRTLLVCPPWEVPPDGTHGGRTRIVIEPGRAFGTGSHATTRACLELLERTLAGQSSARAVDVGTGSGILAIAAARLGVPIVVAVDPDPDAVAAARANAERNGVADRIGVELSGVEEWSGPPAGLVLANLLGRTLVTLAPVLARCVAAAGRLIAGGLLVHETPAVIGAFVPEGFALVEIVEHEGWAGLLLAREHAPVPGPA